MTESNTSVLFLCLRSGARGSTVARHGYLSRACMTSTARMVKGIVLGTEKDQATYAVALAKTYGRVTATGWAEVVRGTTPRWHNARVLGIINTLVIHWKTL